jgi:hypothetical protein
MNTAQNFSVRTGSGVVHSLTDGRAYWQHGQLVHNDAESVIGKADCGSQTSSAAKFTNDPVNCKKCLKVTA